MRILIPVENQVRELDPKLLLACIAAERGFSSVIGSRREMEFNIDLFPQSIYLSKSMTIRSLLFFQVARRFDIEIVTWDEEALVHLPPETYFSRRLDPRAIKYVSHLFAWGEDNARLWRQYPHLPDGIRFTSPVTRAVTCCDLNCSRFIKKKLKNIRLDTVILSW